MSMPLAIADSKAGCSYCNHVYSLLIIALLRTQQRQVNVEWKLREQALQNKFAQCISRHAGWRLLREEGGGARVWGEPLAPAAHVCC